MCISVKTGLLALADWCVLSKFPSIYFVVLVKSKQLKSNLKSCFAAIQGFMFSLRCSDTTWLYSLWHHCYVWLQVQQAWNIQPEKAGKHWFSAWCKVTLCESAVDCQFKFHFTLAVAMSYWAIRWLHPTASSLLSWRQVNPVTSELVTGSSLCKLRPFSKFHTCWGNNPLINKLFLSDFLIYVK